MFLGSERLRHEEPAGGVRGGTDMWMNVFCTEEQRLPKEHGVSIIGQGVDGKSAGDICAGVGVGVEGNACIAAPLLCVGMAGANNAGGRRGVQGATALQAVATHCTGVR